MKKYKRITGVIMALLVFLLMSGMVLPCLDEAEIYGATSSSISSEKKEKTENAEDRGDRSQADDKKTDDVVNTGDVPETSFREISIKADETVLYRKGKDGRKHQTDEFRSATRFWNALTGRKAGPDSDDDPVIVTVSGLLPDDVTAKAEFIRFDESGEYEAGKASALYSLVVVLKDAEGNNYIPEEPLTVKLEGGAIRAAAKAGDALLVYSYEENKEREASLEKTDNKKDYAADVLVYGINEGSETVDKAAKNTEGSFRTDEDAISFVYDEDGYEYTDNDCIEFGYEYGYSLDEDAEGDDAYVDSARFMLSVKKDTEKTAKEDSQDKEKKDGEGSDNNETDKSAGDKEDKAAAKLQDRQTTLTATDRKTYKVTVTYDKSAGLPEDTELDVKLIDSDKSAYEGYIDKAADALDSSSEELTFAHAFDITLVDPKTGMHYQPDSNVNVSIELLRDNISEHEDVGVVHFKEGILQKTLGIGKGKAEVMDAGVTDGNVEFATDGFSVYVVAGYTVDFHWGDYTYSIVGNTGIYLSDLLMTLADNSENKTADTKLLKKIAADLNMVESVGFSNENLVKVERKSSKKSDNDWLLTSLAAFDTEEKLTIKLSDGENIVIRVTDANEVCQIARTGVKYNTIQAAYNAAANNDTIEMLQDCTVGSTISFNRNITVTLTTAGSLGRNAVIDRNSRVQLFRLSSGNVTIRNLTLDGKDLWVYEEGSLISITGGTLHLSSGSVLQNGVASDLTGLNVNGGGAVFVDGGNLFMDAPGTGETGPVIRNCRGAGNGGGVKVASGTFTMNGGTIRNCASDPDWAEQNNYGKGGGVYVHNTGRFIMNGGTIEGCRADRRLFYAGGGVCIDDPNSTFTMNGGEIRNCSAPNSTGGGIAIGHTIRLLPLPSGTCATATISGGMITGCTADEGGSAIEVHGRLNMSGGSVTGNSGADGAIVFYSTTNFDADFFGRLYLSGTPKIYGNGGKDVVVNNGTTTKLTVSGTMGADALVYVYDSNPQVGNRFGTYNNASYISANANVFKSDRNDMLVGNDGGSNKLVWKKLVYVCKIVDNGREVPFETLSDALTYARNEMGGTAVIQMLRDVELTSALNVVSGNDITITTAATSGGVYNSEVDKAVIKRNFTGGSSMISNSGKLTLDSVTLDGGKKSSSAAGSLVNNSGELFVNGAATLQNAVTSGNGGAVYAASGSTTVIKGAITGNSASSGAALYADNNANVTVDGGNISGNTASGTNGGAINIGGASTLLTFKGNAKVTGNSGSGGNKNVVLSENSDTVIKSADLGTGASVGIFVTGDANTDPFKSHGQSTQTFGDLQSGNNAENYFNDVNGLTGEAGTGDKNGKLVWQTIQPPRVEVTVKKTWDVDTAHQYQLQQPVSITISAKKTEAAGGETVQVTAYSAETGGSVVTQLKRDEVTVTTEEGKTVWTRTVWVPKYISTDGDIKEYSIDESEDLEVLKDPDDPINGDPGVWTVTYPPYEPGTPTSTWEDYSEIHTTSPGNYYILFIPGVLPTNHTANAVRFYYTINGEAYRTTAFFNNYELVRNEKNYIIIPFNTEKYPLITYDYSGGKEIRVRYNNTSTFRQYNNWGFDFSRNKSNFDKEIKATSYTTEKRIDEPGPGTLSIVNTFTPNKVLTIKTNFVDDSLDKDETANIAKVKYKVVDNTDGKTLDMSEVVRDPSTGDWPDCRVYVPADHECSIQQTYFELKNGTQVAADGSGEYTPFVPEYSTNGMTYTEGGSVTETVSDDETVRFRNTRKADVTVRAKWETAPEDPVPSDGINYQFTYGGEPVYYGGDPLSAVHNIRKKVTDTELEWTDKYSGNQAYANYSITGDPLECETLNLPEKVTDNYRTSVDRDESSDNKLTFTIDNKIKKGTITVIKRWECGDWGIDLPSAVRVEVYDKNNQPVTGSPLELNESNDWTAHIENLPINEKYSVLETEANVDGTWTPMDNTRYSASYMMKDFSEEEPKYVKSREIKKLREEGAAFVVNNSFDAIARVSNNGGSWKYFSYIINSEADPETVKKGAFDYANTLSGDVVVETLKETHERYTLSAGFVFSNTDIENLTIRTMPGLGFRSTLKKDQPDGPMIKETFTGMMTTEDIILDGGAVFTKKDDGTYEITGITSNGSGGIIKAESSSLVISKGTTLQNVYGCKLGSAVHVDKQSSLRIEGLEDDHVNMVNCWTSLQRDSAGGAVYAASRALSVDYSDFTNCQAFKEGAAIKDMANASETDIEGTSATIQHSTFTDCKATDPSNGDGGAVQSTAERLVLKTSTFTGCTAAAKQGGAVQHYFSALKTGSETIIEDCVFTDCKALGTGSSVYGGAVNTDAYSATVKSSTFTRCSGKMGGALSNCSNNDKNNGGTLTVESCTFDQCKTSTGGSQGGALYINKGTATLKANSFDGCEAKQGGAVYVRRGTVSVENVGNNNNTIINCVADTGGGFQVQEGSLMLKGTTLIDNCNTAILNNRNNLGGGVYLVNTTAGQVCKLEMTEGTPQITNCNAANGGGICANGISAEVTISAGTISDNITYHYGGGAIRIEGGSTVTISGGEISNNYVEDVNGVAKYGGAINVKKGTLNIQGGLISGNYVKGKKGVFGGAVYLSGDQSGDECVFNMTGGTISGNYLTDDNNNVYGAAIAIYGSRATGTISGGTINGNHADTANKDAFGGAVSVTNGAKLTMSGGAFNQNYANGGRKSIGGGIYVDASSSIKLSGNPAFGSGTSKNYVAVTGYSGKKNGGEEVYSDGKARQDIYTEESAADPASIIVTGNIGNQGDDSSKGSIWVWANSSNHYEKAKPFAIIQQGVTISEKTRNVFRNAQDDTTTKNDTDTYLFGTTGSNANFIYWTGSTGSRRVVLRKINGSYNPVEGASFIIYPTKSTSATPISGGGTAADPLVSSANGVFFSGMMDYNTYYIYESYNGSTKWFELVVNESGFNEKELNAAN